MQARKRYLELCLRFCLKGIEYDETRGTPHCLVRAEKGRERAKQIKRQLDSLEERNEPLTRYKVV